MTYKQLTQEIEEIDKQVQFMTDMQNTITDKESHTMIYEIIKSLRSWSGYLRCKKDYVSRECYELMDTVATKLNNDLEEAQKTIRDLEAKLNKENEQ